MRAHRPSSSRPATVGEVLEAGVRRLAAAGIDEGARLDAGLIVAEVLGVDRLAVLTTPERRLDGAQSGRIHALLNRRAAREPMAYLLGRREFYGLDFEVTPDVLIPRPETELLVETMLTWLAQRPADAPVAQVADVGTGSGAIAVTVAAHERLPGGVSWIATDCSEAALAVARRNARRHGVADRIEFRHGSLLDPIDAPLDAIVSNPPYVSEGEWSGLAPELTRYEPRGALVGGPDGLDLIRRLIADAPERLRPGGLLAVEIGADQGDAVRALAAAQPGLVSERILCDLAYRPRVLTCARQA